MTTGSREGRHHSPTTLGGQPPMATYTREDVLSWRDRDLIDNDGDKIGTIDDIYLDRETDRAGMGGRDDRPVRDQRTFVPLARRSRRGRRPRPVREGPRSRTRRTSTPTASSRSEEERDALPALRARLRRATTGLRRARRRHRRDDRHAARRDAAAGHDTSGPNTDDAMTRSEEELRVGTTERETGRARLRSTSSTEIR